MARVTLRQGNGRFLEARLEPGGDLVFEGQDLGDEVAAIFGDDIREYEWTWTIAATHLPRLEAELGPDVLAGLAARFSGPAAEQLGAFLEQLGVPRTTWSRLGD